MYFMGRVGSLGQKERFLAPMIAERSRSAFFMTKPAEDGGAGFDPPMMRTIVQLDGNHWVVDGRKASITGANGASVGTVMARTDAGDDKMTATMFLIALPDPAPRIERALDTIDSSMPGGNGVVAIEGLRAPARLPLASHCRLLHDPPAPEKPPSCSHRSAGAACRFPGVIIRRFSPAPDHAVDRR